ncbi:MAG: hypothetical protein QM817_31170 [Archangium sp.]
MLGILSTLNWLMAALYVALLIVVGIMMGEHMPFHIFALIGAVVMLCAAPSAYLGYVIEKGRGRGLQTVFAVLALANFPLGTAYGAFALWVCWSLEAEVFERGGVDAMAPKKRVARKKSARIEEEEESEGEGDYVSPVRPDSPYALAKQLKSEGVDDGEIQEELAFKDLDAEEIETVMGAAGLRFSRLKQKSINESRARRKKVR